jgi:uncharacterized membrane protein YsdA (DUF1294 family)
MHPLAARRILRLALGTALALCFSQVITWPLSFITPALTLMILALPLPAPVFKKGLVFIAALLAPVVGGLALLPFLEHARLAGILLVALALFYSFYYTARGGSPIIGTFMTIGLTLVITIGSVNSTVLILLIQSLAKAAVFGMAFVWVAHALLPDLPRDQPAAARPSPAPAPAEPADAGRNALRSMLIVLPLVLAFLFMSGSPAYTVVMIKVASMGQQASTDKSREMGRSLLTSTLYGGVGAIAAWYVLSAWASLLMYTLLIGLAGLLYGRRVFHGPAVHPDFSTWSYAFLTMLVILAPAVLDSPASAGAGAAFWSRLFLFVLIALYGTVSVAVFDAFWPARNTGRKVAKAAPQSN